MILLTGPSASGKTEIAKVLNKLYGIKKVITHTTRQIRINEKRDIDYHFVTKEEFLKLKENDYFVETTFYNNNYYGTSKIELGKDKILIVDPNGKDTFVNLHDKDIIIFYLRASNEIRRKRMIERGDALDSIEQRLKKDRTWFNKDSEANCDFIIENEDKTLIEIAKEIYEKYLSKINTK